jgi:hypothetical protein
MPEAPGVALSEPRLQPVTVRPSRAVTRTIWEIFENGFMSSPFENGPLELPNRRRRVSFRLMPGYLIRAVCVPAMSASTSSWRRTAGATSAKTAKRAGMGKNYRLAVMLTVQALPLDNGQKET